MMKKALILAVVVLAAGSLSAVTAQDAPTVSTPSIADNASPLDNSIKMRSVELERVKREAEKTATIRRDNGKELNFSLIKDDFEGIQMAQMEIVKIYSTSEVIDYKAIASHADKITEMATRLRGNVFESAEKPSDASAARDEKNPYAGKSIRDLIVALDNAIGDVVTAPMWQKLAVIDPESSKVVEENLVKVIEASSALWIESKKKTSK
jgi:hypothetical protein